MSFRPISTGFSTSLLGSSDPVKFSDPLRFEKRLVERNIHGSTKVSTIEYTLIIIVISAIIFVTVVAIYDIFRSMSYNYYANLSLLNPESNNTLEDIQRTLIVNQGSLKANITFAIFCIVLALALIPLLLYFIG
jgi:hypothetical protein